MEAILSYPRSGSHLLQHMIHACEGNVLRLHKPDGWKITRLILLIRDHRECLIREHFPRVEQISNHHVNEMIGGKGQFPASLFFYNLRYYNAFSGPKMYLYYEDLLLHGEFYRVAQFMNLDISKLNWEKEFKISLDNYLPPKMSGGKIVFHQNRLMDPAYYDTKVRAMDSEMSHEYLRRYDSTRRV